MNSNPALIQFKLIKLSLSAVSCVAQESIISFSCKYKVLCVSQVQHCTNTHDIKCAITYDDGTKTTI